MRIRRYTRSIVFFVSLIFTALLCVTIDILNNNEENIDQVQNIERVDDRRKRGIPLEERVSAFLEVNLDGLEYNDMQRNSARHSVSIVRKQQHSHLQNASHFTTQSPLSSSQKRSSSESSNSYRVHRVNSEIALNEKTITLNEILKTRHEANSTSSRLTADQKSHQDWLTGIKSDLVQRTRQKSLASGQDFDGSSTGSDSGKMDRPWRYKTVASLSSAQHVKSRHKIHGTHTQLHSLKYIKEFLKTKRDEEMITYSGLSGIQNPLDKIIVRDILWGPMAEEITPNGLEGGIWRKQARASTIVNVIKGCGRMQNRMVITEDGTKMCARYRLNIDQIQGEVFSYYLSQVLGIRNVPPIVLSEVNYYSPHWSKVREQIEEAGWIDGKLVVLSQWVPKLLPAYIPIELRGEPKQFYPTSVVNRTYSDISELVQWSDMIVFDYLTGNSDRLSNNMFNRQWNDLIMDSPVHNLEKSKESGLLIFFDNESGLLHSYRVLDTFDSFQREILSSLCIFRAKTAHVITELFNSKNILERLTDEYESNEGLHAKLTGLPHRNIDILNKRIADVHRQIEFCTNTFKHTSSTSIP